MSIQTSPINVLTNSMNVKKRTDIHARWITTTVDVVVVVVDVSVAVAIVVAVVAIPTTVTTSSNKINKKEYTLHTLSKQSHVEIVLYTHSYCICLYILSNSLWRSKKSPPIRMDVRIYRIKHQSLLMLKSDALCCVRAFCILRIMNFLFANFYKCFENWIEINGDNESATNVWHTYTLLENGSSWFMTEILSSDFEKKTFRKMAAHFSA